MEENKNWADAIIQPLCNVNTDGSISYISMPFIGLWMFLSAGTTCNCCISARIAILLTLVHLVGFLRMYWLSATIIALVVLASFIRGYFFAKAKTA